MFKELNTNGEETKHRKFIEAVASKYLSEQHNVIIGDPQGSFTTTIYFILSMMDYLTQRASEGHHGTYNLGDVIEVNYGMIDGEPRLIFLPGVSAKLTIKQDSMTENS